jgi:hypothetical protein
MGSRGFIVQEKNIEINWAIATPYMAKEKTYRMEIVALRS